MSEQVRKGVVMAAAFAGALLGAKYLLPLVLPFGMGLVLALMAEPAVAFGVRRLRCSRGLAAGLGVSLTLILLVGVLSLLGALAVRELGVLAGALPSFQKTARQGVQVLEDWMVSMAQNLPEDLSTAATGRVLELFDGGTVLIDQVTQRVPAMVGSVLGWLPDGALGLGTGVLSAFLFSARLPKLRDWISARMPPSWKEKTLPALGRVGKALLAWLKAQGKLMGLTYLLVALGLTVLGVGYGFLWAAVIALVDAIPVLGTGTVLIPWGAVCLLQGKVARGIGLLVIYAAALLTRTVLEPRIVGKHLGLDPLVTLLFLYVGYRVWGLMGMLMAPLLASAVSALGTKQGT